MGQGRNPVGLTENGCESEPEYGPAPFTETGAGLFARAAGYLLPCTYQYIRVLRAESEGFICCAPIAELAPPLRLIAPKSTLTDLPPTGSVAVTGEGGRPPPV